jgi:hypothetical protein
MKINLRFLLLLATCLPIIGFAQGPRKKVVASTAQLQMKAGYQPKFDQVNAFESKSMVKAANYLPTQITPTPTGKVASVSPVQLGTASNALTALRGETNQVSVDNMTDAVAFIHRQDVTIWGGGTVDNGKLRYDISVDNGGTFANDIGPIQTVYTNYGRYPNCLLINPNSSANPFDGGLAYLAPTNRFPTPGWIGQVNGVAQVATSSPITSTEHYQFDGQQVLLPGGLCKGKPGEYWAVDFGYDGTNLLDSMRLQKGVWNTSTSDIDWTLIKFPLPYDISYDGSIHAVGPITAFSPDGMHGWIGILSNLTTGTNTNSETYMPVFVKTDDGGATWSAPMEVDLDGISWIADSLQTLWIDTTGNPASDGRATTGFDFDIVVDNSGNVHMGVVVGTHATGFSISSGLAKMLVDVYTPDGGATWNATYLSPVLTFRGTYGQGSAPITIDNMVQTSTDDNGDYIFFSWSDSDTSLFTGSMSGVGFGEANNLAPNLRVTAKRVMDGALTYPRLITDGDILWEGRALNPTMSPTVVMNNGVASLPIVMLDLLQNDPNLSTQFWYFGNDATFDVATESTWCDPNQMTLAWPEFSTPGFTPICAVGNNPTVGGAQVILNDCYPNPTQNQAVLGFELPSVMNVKLTMTNVYGQQIAVLANGELNAGAHSVTIETGNLASGVYFCNMFAGDVQLSKKLIVTK